MKENNVLIAYEHCFIIHSLKYHYYVQTSSV